MVCERVSKQVYEWARMIWSADAARIATAHATAKVMSNRVLIRRHYARRCSSSQQSPLMPRMPARAEASSRAMSERVQRLLEAARRPVPEGTFVVGLGLLVSGLTAYGFQIVSYRALPKADYTAL